MLITARYRHLFPQITGFWIEAEIFSLTGGVRKPDSEGLNILPCKALSSSRFPKVNTWEANATGSLAFHAFFDSVDCSRHHSPRAPVSGTKNMGLDCDLMS